MFNSNLAVGDTVYRVTPPSYSSLSAGARGASVRPAVVVALSESYVDVSVCNEFGVHVRESYHANTGASMRDPRGQFLIRGV